MSPPALNGQYPAFPDNLPILPLARLSYAKLLSNDAVESEKLFQAAKDQGFFLPDLSDTPDGETTLRDVEATFGIGKSFFELGLEEKKKFQLDYNNIG